MRKPSEQADTSDPEGLTEAQVLDYLAAHPEFIGRHAERLAPLATQQTTGDRVVDLQRFLVDRIQQRGRALEGERDQLVVLARLNLKSQARVHRAVLSLMAARSFEHLMQAATIDMPTFLGLDAASLCMEASAMPPPRSGTPGVHVLEPGEVDRMLGPERDMLLRADVRGERTIFGPAATLVRSDALLRLRVSETAPIGLLALGSRKVNRFHPGQGTELLGFLARALEYSIRAWLDLP